jgi:vancomycin resistance protein YoaR
MSKKQKTNDSPVQKNSLFFLLTVFLLGLLTAIAAVYLIFLSFYAGKIFPGVKIANMEMGGQTYSSAYQILNADYESRTEKPLRLNFQEQIFNLDLAQASPEVDLQAKTVQAFGYGRMGNPLENFRDQIKALIFGTNFDPQLTFNKPSSLNLQISQIAQFVQKDPVNAQVIVGENMSLVPAQTGQKLDEQILLKQLDSYLTLKSPAPQVVPLTVLTPNFTDLNAQKAKLALEKVNQLPLKLHFEDQTWTIGQNILISFLDLNPSKAPDQPLSSQIISHQLAENRSQQLLINQGKLIAFVQNIADKINIESKDAKFEIDKGVAENQLRVKQFQPAQEGRNLETDQTVDLIIHSLTTDSPAEITLPVVKTAPKITTDSVNNFGIKQLLAQGISNFSGSIENRIFNVGLAASRLHGAMVAPGEIFSFNKTIGDVSGTSGYKPAYVIKSGRTVLDDGGGVCQVSTTVFRAALKAGLPITERTAHAYRVGYYEQGFPPGLDATVFSPSVDLKFKNDTDFYILIQAYTQGTTLYVDLYGTADGRVSQVSTPIISSQTPPPPDVRQDDPTLLKGTTKQVDWQAWGANVSFTRIVEKNGEKLISETWKSAYKPWAAVYLVGTQ